MRSARGLLASLANGRRPSECSRATVRARRQRGRPPPRRRPPQRRQPVQRGQAGAGAPRTQNRLAASAPHRPLVKRSLPWQTAKRSRKSPRHARGLVQTMSAWPLRGTSGLAASKSATGSYTQAKRQTRRNTQRSDSAGRSRSSVTADRKVELTAAVSLAATTGGLFFLADEGQDEGAAVRRGAGARAGRCPAKCRAARLRRCSEAARRCWFI